MKPTFNIIYDYSKVKQYALANGFTKEEWDLFHKDINDRCSHWIHKGSAVIITYDYIVPHDNPYGIQGRLLALYQFLFNSLALDYTQFYILWDW